MGMGLSAAGCVEAHNGGLWASNGISWSDPQCRIPAAQAEVSENKRASGTSAAPRRLDRVDVDLLHGHHRVKRALCVTADVRKRVGQHARRDLPGDTPLVLAPAGRALRATIADDGVPVAVGSPADRRSRSGTRRPGKFKRRWPLRPMKGIPATVNSTVGPSRPPCRMDSHWVRGRRPPPRCREGSRRRSGQQPLGVLVVPEDDRVLAIGCPFASKPIPAGDGASTRRRATVAASHVDTSHKLIRRRHDLPFASDRPDAEVRVDVRAGHLPQRDEAVVDRHQRVAQAVAVVIAGRGGVP